MSRAFAFVCGILSIAAFAAPVKAQTVTGNVSIQVQNNFSQTQSIGTNLIQCTGCTYSPNPPTFISYGSLSSAFVATPTTSGTTALATVAYGTNVGSQQYVCQFQATTLVSLNGGPCGTPTISAVATDGVYPSPHCTAGTPQINPTTCNYSITFTMAN